MERKTDWQNFYVPENYREALAELKGALPCSFSKAMQESLVELFKKHGIPFTDKP